MIYKLGYCCINQTLRNLKPSVYSSRSIARKNFSIQLASERALQNVKDILTILTWNESHNIRSFRIGSEPLPRSGDMLCPYKLDDLPDASTIRDILATIGRYAHDHDHSLSFHPGQYVCLGSPRPEVCELGIYALHAENDIANAICRDVDLDIPINIHVGSSYGCEYDATAERFTQSFSLLDTSLKQRITLENDDKASGWSVQRLYKHFYETLSIPICFDFHHWLFCNDGDDIKHDFDIAHSTWGNRSMQVHYSQSPTSKVLVPKHSDYYRDPLPEWLCDVNCHVHLECKQKELALLKYRQDFPQLSDIKELCNV